MCSSDLPGRGRHNTGLVADAISASALPDDLSWTMPRALRADELHAMVDDFTQSVQRLQRCGFSGIEISAGHGHLFHQFLSPWMNLREDEYGGDVEGRTRFLRELVSSLRAACGKNFIIGLKLPGDDGVPGGIGLTAYLNRLYGPAGILGSGYAMVLNFHAAVSALRKDLRNPLIALVVSDEAATYRPEMEWLAQQLQLAGKRVHCLHPDDLFPLGNGLCFDIEGNPEKIDIVYRFFELFDLPNVRSASYILEAWAAGELAVTPPLRPFQEEKLGFGLFHHHRLESTSKRSVRFYVFPIFFHRCSTNAP